MNLRCRGAILVCFAISLYLLASCDFSAVVSVTAAGDGSVTISPESVSHRVDSLVTLTATPENGGRFLYWEGDIESEENPLTVMVRSDMELRAVFLPVVLGNGQVILTDHPSQSLSVGECADFTLDLSLPEGGRYRVWIFPLWGHWTGGATSYFGTPSGLIEANSTDLVRGGGLCYGGPTDRSLRAPGTIDQWQLIVELDGTETVDRYIQETFTYRVVWEPGAEAFEPASTTALSGHFLYDGSRLHAQIAPSLLGVKNVDTDAWLRDVEITYDEATSEYALTGLPEAEIYLWVVFPYNPSGWQLGGNYLAEAEHVFLDEMSETDRGSHDIDLFHVIHLTTPYDNETAQGSVAQGRTEYETYSSPTTFTWDPVPEATRYFLSISRYRSPDHVNGYGLIEKVVSVNVTTNSYTASLAELGDSEHYEFAISAFDGSNRIGYFLCAGSDGSFAREYRFRVES